MKNIILYFILALCLTPALSQQPNPSGNPVAPEDLVKLTDQDWKDFEIKPNSKYPAYQQYSFFEWHHLVPKGPNHYWRMLQKHVKGPASTFSAHDYSNGLLLWRGHHAALSANLAGSFKDVHTNLDRRILKQKNGVGAGV